HGEKDAGMLLRELEDVAAVDRDQGEKERAEKAEVGDAEQRVAEHATLPHFPPVARDRCGEIPDESGARVSSRGAWRERDRSRADHSNPHVGEPGRNQVALEEAVHVYARNRSAEDRQVGGELEDAVGEREILVLEDLRKDAVLRGTEEGAV